MTEARLLVEAAAALELAEGSSGSVDNVSASTRHQGAYVRLPLGEEEVL